MFLIGQYDSPFVRRVAIAMRVYGLPFEHRPWSVFKDADAVAAYNPLLRVPTLVLDDGEALIESAAILDHLDELVGPAKALTPAQGPVRRRALKVCALATGLGDKAISLVYERALHQQTSPAWIARCKTQIAAVLDALEADRRARPEPYWFGETLSHADIAVACVLRFTREAQPELIDNARWPALTAHSARCEALPPFREIAQPFAPPPQSR
jgi:glutathione S-transferase